MDDGIPEDIDVITKKEEEAEAAEERGSMIRRCFATATTTATTNEDGCTSQYTGATCSNLDQETNSPPGSAIFVMVRIGETRLTRLGL